MRKLMMLGVCAGMSVLAMAQSKEEFLKQQAYAEMQRVAGQVDILEQNQGDLAARVGKVEAMKREIDDLKSNVSALQSQLADLKTQMAKQRSEIIAELGAVIKKAGANRPAPPPPAPVSSYTGPTRIYSVESGDTLSLIADAFETKVSVIKELNSLKNDNIRVGQKLRVPATK